MRVVLIEMEMSGYLGEWSSSKKKTKKHLKSDHSDDE